MVVMNASSEECMQEDESRSHSLIAVCEVTRMFGDAGVGILTITLFSLLLNPYPLIGCCPYNRDLPPVRLGDVPVGSIFRSLTSPTSMGTDERLDYVVQTVRQPRIRLKRVGGQVGPLDCKKTAAARGRFPGCSFMCGFPFATSIGGRSVAARGETEEQ
ncbi:hypothetical protein P879_03232 [Paragonimus westermani]|uniref:Uncharacterized protein n=1 Tax=Paragonimus westermani TaxID=34504 RepID=A0A8T0DL62_9TREM|nr:hypothetical protein P879_03232 [Paragonimus westermani]